MNFRAHFRRYLPLLLILVLFSVAVLAHSAALPLIEGSDEDLHYLYVEHLRASWTLPDRASVDTNPTKQVSGHPPLTYAVAVVIANALNLPSMDAAIRLYDELGVARNPWNTPGNIWNRRDNHNFYYIIGAAQPPREFALRALRLMSLLWGIVAIIGAYVGARAVLRERRWALAAAALYAFLPTFLHSAAYFNNDISAAALATWALAVGLVAIRATDGRGTPRPYDANSAVGTGRALSVSSISRYALLSGILVALAGLAKVSALFIAPACGLAVLWAAQRSWRSIVINSLLWLLPIMLLFGAWALWGWQTYDDPFGTLTHNRPGFYHDPPLTLPQLLPRLPEAYLSYLGRFGLSAYLHPMTYTILGAVIVIAMIGCVIGTRRASSAATGTRHAVSVRTVQFMVLVIAAVLMLAGLARWMQTVTAVVGRLLLPAQLAYMLLIMIGLRRLALRLPRLDTALRGMAIGSFAAAGLLASTIATSTAYAPPTPALVVAGLQGEVRDYEGAIRLLGYQAPAQLDGESYPVTICWHALNIPLREPAYTVKLIGSEGIVSERTSLMGLGLFPRARWRVGDEWCETIELPLEGRALASGEYQLALALLDTVTFASDWQVTDASGQSVTLPTLGFVRAE
jgi:4-amino-4-deoxy-L-arabinose transferase-like glycosyltransferase